MFTIVLYSCSMNHSLYVCFLSLSSRNTILVKLESVGPMYYQPGDHVAIYPQNNTSLVKELLERLPLPCDPDLLITVQSKIVTNS